MKFTKYRKIWFSISFIAIAIGVFAMVSNRMNNGSVLNYGIDFTGGSVMEVQLTEGVTPEIEAVYQTIDAVFPGAVGQITITGDDTYVIQSKEMSDAQSTTVSEAITESFGTFELIRANTIGPKVGNSLKKDAAIALTVTLIAIVLYIAYAFRKVPKKVSPWKFGFAAIVALAHDIIITLGIFALLGLEVNAFFITALLTIMGFSVHDTIVVFDRIRENLKKQGRDDTFGDIADISLKQTMARSINTSVSTLFPLLALYIWGSPSISTFIFALIVGIFVGTYSSIFIASPVLTMWQESGRVR